MVYKGGMTSIQSSVAGGPGAVDVEAVLARYLAVHPDEAQRQAGLVEFLAATRKAAGERAGDRFVRTNFAGHITASGIVVDRDARRVLLIHHAFLDCWLQPGGHVDATDETLVAAARREIVEETGLPATALKLLSVDGDAVQDDTADELFAVPFDIDSHTVPARPARGEPGHVHHDFRFVFAAAEAAADRRLASVDASEIHSSRWFDFSALADGTMFGTLLRKVERL